PPARRSTPIGITAALQPSKVQPVGAATTAVLWLALKSPIPAAQATAVTTPTRSAARIPPATVVDRGPRPAPAAARAQAQQARATAGAVQAAQTDSRQTAQVRAEEISRGRPPTGAAREGAGTGQVPPLRSWVPLTLGSQRKSGHARDGWRRPAARLATGARDPGDRRGGPPGSRR